jgi:hypothetical protein
VALLDTLSRFGLPAVVLLVSIIPLYLQYEGNRSSSEDAKKLLEAITEQTFVVRGIANKQLLERERAVSGGKKAETERGIGKNPSRRRLDVNNERRQKSKDHKTAFGRSRSH